MIRANYAATVRSSGEVSVGLSYWEARQRRMHRLSIRMERLLVLAVVASNLGALATLLL